MCGQKYALFVKSAYLLPVTSLFRAFCGLRGGLGGQKYALTWTRTMCATSGGRRLRCCGQNVERPSEGTPAYADVVYGAVRPAGAGHWRDRRRFARIALARRLPILEGRDWLVGSSRLGPLAYRSRV